jgi:hypothetical protein
VFGVYTGGSFVYTLDARTDTVTASSQVVGMPCGLSYSEATDRFYSTNTASGSVSVIAGDGSAVLKTLPLGDDPVVFASVPRHGRIYVGDLGRRWVYVIRDSVTGVEERPVAPEVGLPMAVAPSHSAAGFGVSYSLSRDCAVDVSVLSIAGARVQTLATGTAQAGTHRVEWTPARSLPTGLYFVRLEAQGRSTTRTVVLTR